MMASIFFMSRAPDRCLGDRVARSRPDKPACPAGFNAARPERARSGRRIRARLPVKFADLRNTVQQKRRSGPAARVGGARRFFARTRSDGSARKRPRSGPARARGRGRGRGGTGRRTRFRFWRRKAWGFKSLRPHHSIRASGCFYGRIFRGPVSCLPDLVIARTGRICHTDDAVADLGRSLRGAALGR